MGLSFKFLHKYLILAQLRNDCAAFRRNIQMTKALISLSALIVLFSVSAAQASTVNFDSGSAKMKKAPIANSQKHQQKKVWVPAQRSNGRLIKGHYIWR